ncbi:MULTISPECIES: copper resistance protein CopC [unclassified Rhodococcus (in: high G+C Gram-positive bacteria)]|uniref:copper resistance CopC/CopD family protein n=1 Tax=unclassified Rhodococcus (in: high G+C Gram-positive bacteria) TaxID=192944 RepID=UPI00163B07A5|nr:MULTISPECIES: copper resistance protein CopC [unclassified Rhodococcus (in: high G+C Gram-positive bacteria)]MBC2644850.1 copper resistance protein CopC/CopD [Rhodococcus sp. 3A]MBC2890851.1 copper resistance protein CopC/CopD [Rhodococcus sp. 4CII]
MPTAARPLIRGLVLLLALVALAGAGAGVAGAHPTLLFTDPRADTAVSAPPQSITLMFNEPVTPGASAIVVSDSTGRAVPMGGAETARDGRVLTARPAATLAPGTYTVRWQVTGADGDLIEQDFRFAVGLALTGDGSAAGGQSTSWTDAALRWLLFLGLAGALGGLVAERVTATARRENPALPVVRSWIVAASLVGLGGVLGLGAALAVSAGTVSVLWQGRPGLVLLTEATGLMLAAVLASAGRRVWAAAPLVLVVAAEGLRSHANVASPGWGGALTAIHLAAAAIWVGALLHTVRAVLAWWGERAAVRWVLAGYTRLAVWTFLIVVATGTVSALLLIPLAALFSTTYGQVLVVKLVLVAAASGLALAARLALHAPERTAVVRPKIRAESIVLIAVLAVSATLVSTTPAGTSPQPGPPAPQGPVLPLGGLAGQVGISVAASDGQLVVRLSTPRRGDYYAPEPDQDFTLTGRIDTAAGDDSALALRGCGPGCFVAPATWQSGDNLLTLGAAAQGWQGGTVSLLVPWPTEPGGDDLARAVAATRAAGDLTVYETVTSDTTGPVPEPQRLDLPADFFLAQEPYADGTAPIAARLPHQGGVRLALGYPAAGMNVLLTLDDAGRISEETLTDTKHLVTRRFLYPEPGAR